MATKPGRHVYSLVLALAACLCAGDAQTVEPQDVTYIAIDKLVARCRPVVVSIEQEAAPHLYSKLGTGCILNWQGPVILTCKHVVDSSRAEGRLAVGIDTKDGKMVVSVHVARTSDKFDLALLETDKILTPPPHWTGSNDELLSNQKVIGLSIFAADSEITEGAGALMTGFPLGLGNEVERNHPVSRLGIVAQGVYGTPSFLVDASATRGYSGSPIFLCSSGKFAGIVSAQATDAINIVDETKQRVATIPFDVALAACIPASAIREFLEAR